MRHEMPRIQRVVMGSGFMCPCAREGVRARKVRHADMYAVAIAGSVRPNKLTDDQATNTAFVHGLFTALRDSKPAAAKAPAGHQVINTAPPAPAEPVSQFARLYGGKK